MPSLGTFRGINVVKIKHLKFVNALGLIKKSFFCQLTPNLIFFYQKGNYL